MVVIHNNNMKLLDSPFKTTVAKNYLQCTVYKIGFFHPFFIGYPHLCK